MTAAVPKEYPDERSRTDKKKMITHGSQSLHTVRSIFFRAKHYRLYIT